MKNTSNINTITPMAFRVLIAFIFIFTGLIYIMIFIVLYLQSSGDISLIYTTGFTNLLIGAILFLFTFGWLFVYWVYTGVIKPSYETFSIIKQMIEGISTDREIDRDKIRYLQEFIHSSLSTLKQSTMTHSINFSKDTKVYIQKLESLTQQNEALSKSQEALSQLVEKLERQRNLLELEQAKTTAIINAIPNGLLASSRDGNIFLVNQETEKLLGIQADQVLGRFIYKVLPPIEEDTDSYTSQNNIQKSRNTRIFTYDSPDSKQKIILENTANPIILNNDIVGVVDVLRDKTQDHETARAQKEFVSIASHQLRTPITSIKWNAELILSTNNLNQEIKDATNDIYKESNRMEKLVNALLNLSRIDLGTIKFITQKIQIDSYIDALVKQLELDINRKNIIFKKDILYQDSIQNDPVYLDIIIGNILSNAVKYTHLNGTVTLVINRLIDQDVISITISDTGIGIPESQQAQVFGRLFRADNAKNSETDGNGLGLYVVKKLIEAMDGHIWFESIENQGTTFFLEIPIILNGKHVL